MNSPPTQMMGAARRSGSCRRNTAQRVRARNAGHQREKTRRHQEPTEPGAGVAHPDPFQGEHPEHQAPGPGGQVRLLCEAPAESPARKGAQARSRPASSTPPEETRSRAESRRPFPRPCDGATRDLPGRPSRSSASPGPARQPKSCRTPQGSHGKELDNFTWSVIAIAGGEDGETVGAGCRPQIGRARPGEGFDRWQAGRDRPPGRPPWPGRRWSDRRDGRIRLVEPAANPAGARVPACRPGPTRPP